MGQRNLKWAREEMELEVLEGKRDEQKVGEGEGEGEGYLVSLGLGFREVEERNWRDDISLLRCLHAQLALNREEMDKWRV